MKIFKSHFVYTKSQRNGIFFLVLLIVVLQVLYAFVDFFPRENIKIESNELSIFEKQIDSLRLLEIENRKPKIYPFNPNFITDYKGYTLGMSLAEIDRLHQFRAQNKYVNSAKEFKNITKVSDSLLKKIAPFFKFPSWVTNKIKNKKTQYNSVNTYTKKTVKVSTYDINLATAEDFTVINGIGEKLSERILKYRNRLQGFSYSYQLYEVWNIKPEIITKLLSKFTINEKPHIKKININTASFKEVLKTPYIDYDLCKKIFEYRDEVAELQDISELKNIESFPVDKYERIVLYLKVN